METIDELNEFLSAATQGNNRKLLDLGEARANIRREGQLPEDSQLPEENLDTDLSELGFSLLRASLALKENKGDPKVSRNGFLKAGNAFEALVRNGSPNSPQRGFLRIMGSASYHLAGYSAMAFSLILQREEEPNFAPAEVAIARLILRDLRQLRRDAQNWLRNEAHVDAALQNALDEDTIDFDDALSIILTTTVYRAFAYFEFALATGYADLQEKSLRLLNRGMKVARSSASVSMWWIIRVAINLIDDLWASSLHQILPKEGPSGAENYAAKRDLFIASLYARNVSEIELWPSQIDATRRAAITDDDLVVALPTSAGKTRVAEVCALMALSAGTRVLIITPLRALSAQTERSFRKTFEPLGFSVSSLYGPSGMIPGDDDALRARNIVIATPEKLDFAVRNDKTLIDDVGLIVLDEGHLIGPSDRELRYETLVQRLLLRADADQRRIVCLSAILPEGEQLNDLTAWIRSDAEGRPIKAEWRPTRQRFGTLAWAGDAARLTFGLDDDGPFIQRFVERQPAIPPRRKAFPCDNAELTLAAAWKFAEEDKRTLVFCTQRNHVESYAKKIVDLFQRGFLPLLLTAPEKIERARLIGAEWLGPDHPAVKCLVLGVAIHHARLPNPFLREIERLLSESILTVTVASPTLTQGLNLNAAVLLLPNLYRTHARLTGEEFANVAGRAGRAFVDLEGLVIHVMFDPKSWRRQAWRSLVNSSMARTLESGLIQIAEKILHRLSRGGILNREDAFEYLANSGEAWNINVDEKNDEPLEFLLEKLDNTILGLIEALDADSDDLPQLIDEALNGSLWSRQIARRDNRMRECQLQLFKARSKLIWHSTDARQRRGHYAMGVGLRTGLRLDEMANELAALLDVADEAALTGEVEKLRDSLAGLADRVLQIRPFAPDDPLPSNWRDILASWLAGVSIRDIGPDNLRFIEDVFTYRLVWAIEALRMRRASRGWQPELLAGGAAACLETGLPRFCMAMLVRAGLPSRAAAIEAIEALQPDFVNIAELTKWLQSKEVEALSDKEKWPTPETTEIWKEFRNGILAKVSPAWSAQKWQRKVDPDSYVADPIVGNIYRVEVSTENRTVWICSPDFQPIVRLRRTLNDRSPSVISAKFEEGALNPTIRRVGCQSARWSR